jgi:hypothetical protein
MMGSGLAYGWQAPSFLQGNLPDSYHQTMTENVVVNILIIVLGMVLVFFPKKVARYGIRQNKWLFGLVSVPLNFGEREEKVGAMVVFLVGIFFAACGVLRLLGVG